MEISFVLTGVIVTTLAYLFNKYCIRIYDYWQKRGIPCVDDPLPFVGHTLKMIWSHKTVHSWYDEIYKANKDRSMVGFFQFSKPSLMICDPELVKAVLISDFPKFHESILKVDKKTDPLLAQNPFCNSGEKWKMQRNRLTYALMSGKRLRILCHSVAEVSKKFTKYIHDNVDKSEIGTFEVEGKELSKRFTGEVVARGAFGAEGDFFINGSGPNSFREAVSGLLEPGTLNAILMAVSFFIPIFNKIYSIPIIPKKMDRFFRRVIHEMIVLRSKDGIPRNDFLQLMLDTRKSEDGDIDEEAITASATSFFIDGYETSAATLSFFLYQIAKHPDIQDKLRLEVNTILDKHNGEISYESLKEMTYMDQCLNESMRLYPAAGILVKKCNESCKLVGFDGLEFDIEPGMEITLPLQMIQRDPKYWQNPETYDPERFSDEFKKERPKTVFLPFSEGPRICPGMRFATMQIKGAMATIMKNFVIEVSPKTKEPLEFKRASILLTIEGGLWINFKPLKVFPSLN